MKNKIDLIVIYLGFTNELLIRFLFIYSQTLFDINPNLKVENIYFKSSEAIIYFNMGNYINLSFYFLSIIYIFAIVYKIYINEFVDLKKNTIYFVVLLFFDAILFFFNFRAIFFDSYAFRFVIICLLTNLVVYKKYKKNNIKIE